MIYCYSLFASWDGCFSPLPPVLFHWFSWRGREFKVIEYCFPLRLFATRYISDYEKHGRTKPFLLILCLLLIFAFFVVFAEMFGNIFTFFCLFKNVPIKSFCLLLLVCKTCRLSESVESWPDRREKNGLPLLWWNI